MKKSDNQVNQNNNSISQHTDNCKTVNAVKLILASESPRRKELLHQAGLDFTIIPANIDESGIPDSHPEVYVAKLSKIKAEKIAEIYPDNWVLGADTIVLINNTILGKPESKNDARDMISTLSGQYHIVYTGFSIIYKNENHFHSESVKTEVLFKKLTNREIEWYINTDEPYDKAGGYAIQDIGSFLVKSISGSYTNVVGLPVCEVIDHLSKFGIEQFRR